MNNLFGNLFTRGWKAQRGGGFGNLVHLYGAFQSCPNHCEQHKKGPVWTILTLGSPQQHPSIFENESCQLGTASKLSLSYFSSILIPHHSAIVSFIEALNLILVVRLAGCGPLSHSLKSLWHLVSFDGLPGIHSKRLTYSHIFLLQQRGWVRDTE